MGFRCICCGHIDLRSNFGWPGFRDLALPQKSYVKFVSQKPKIQKALGACLHGGWGP